MVRRSLTQQGQLFSSPLGPPEMLRLFLLVAVCSARERLSVSFRLQTRLPQEHPPIIKYLPFLVDFDERGDVTEGLAFSGPDQRNYEGLLSIDRTGKPHSHDFPGETPFLLRFPNSTFLQKSVVVWLKNEHTTYLKFNTDDYNLQVTAAAYNYTEVAVKTKGTKDELGSCECVKKNCACCVNMKVPHLKFQHELCTNISYNAETIGLDVSIGVDGHYVTWEVSARNPPPICFDVPGTREIAAACLKFEKLDVTKKHVAGCMEVELELIRMRVAHVPIGCFDMPI